MTSLAVLLGEVDALTEVLEPIQHRRFENSGVLVGDVKERLKDLPDECVQCCVTSPPYFGLRSYTDSEAEIGKEQTPDEYVANLVSVFQEVKRVLAKDGLCFVNLGDSYASSGGVSQPHRNTSGGFTGSDGSRTQGYALAGGGFVKPDVTKVGIKPKDLIGIPWRVAFALQADGWWLRQDLIWAKGVSWQKEQRKQVFDAAVEEGCSADVARRIAERADLYGGSAMPESVKDRFTKAHEYVFMLSKSPRYYFEMEREENAESTVKRLASGPVQAIGSAGTKAQIARGDAGKVYTQAAGRNRRSVIALSPRRCKEAHFAVYPPELIEPLILSASRPGDIILDPFGGSGTTAGVAERHDRQAILCELNPEYVELMPARIQSIRNV